jgi:hypothetical protein
MSLLLSAPNGPVPWLRIGAGLGVSAVRRWGSTGRVRPVRRGYAKVRIRAILVTGYLGGATATQVRIGDPWFLFPVALGALGWLGLWLRVDALRDLIPVTNPR